MSYSFTTASGSRYVLSSGRVWNIDSAGRVVFDGARLSHATAPYVVIGERAVFYVACAGGLDMRVSSTRVESITLHRGLVTLDVRSSECLWCGTIVQPDPQGSWSRIGGDSENGYEPTCKRCVAELAADDEARQEYLAELAAYPRVAWAVAIEPPLSGLPDYLPESCDSLY